MPDATVAIIGAGIGGVYLAAELGMLGCRLRLHDLDDSRLADIRARGGIEVEGDPAWFAAIDRVTTDPAAAVDGADVSSRGRSAEYPLHRLHQRQCDAACRQLPRQCRQDRPRRGL